VWEIEVPLAKGRFDGREDLEKLVQDLHAMHEEMFAIADRESHIEVVTWRAKARCILTRADAARVVEPAATGPDRWTRPSYFAATGMVEAEVRRLEALAPGERLAGPAIIESSFTTVVVDPGASVERTAAGNLSIAPD
jgi:N-methylhydantoinase A